MHEEEQIRRLIKQLGGWNGFMQMVELFEIASRIYESGDMERFLVLCQMLSECEEAQRIIDEETRAEVITASLARRPEHNIVN